MYIKNTKYDDDDKLVIGLISFVIIVGIIAVICCFNHNNDNNSDVSNSSVRVVESGLGYAIWVDDETNVMYFESGKGGVSVMINPDGTPKLWKGGEE